jgi:hypothetical protein
MNDETTNLDQADEDIFTPTVSDEALEAAAMGRRAAEQNTALDCTTYPTSMCRPWMC